MIHRQVAAMVASKNASTNKKGGESGIEGIISAIKAMAEAPGKADVSSAAAAAPLPPKKSVTDVAEVQLRAIPKKAKFD